MENTAFREQLDLYGAAFEKVLADYLQSVRFRPDVLDESVRYSLQSGGKRLRPVLLFAVTRLLGGRLESVAPFALALELIHTYSLIHDDLPAMDNDDYRRGRLSNHRVFGEGQAILAGDALLNEAYRICFEACTRGKTYVAAAELLCRNAGPAGMIAGQAADLYYQGREYAGKREAEFIVVHKTAMMLRSAVTVPAIVADLDENIRALLDEFGKQFGILFQLTDDMLDVTGDFAKLGKSIGKDAEENKLSYVQLYGMDECAALADHALLLCEQLLGELPYDASFLLALARYVRGREA